MANPSPTCVVRINGGAQLPTTNGVNCNGGDTVEIDLASVSGVGVWGISIVGQDDLVTPPALTIDALNKKATFTAPAAPWALRFQSTVGVAQVLGQDANFVTQQSFTTTLAIYALAGAYRLIATNERAEGSASFGWIATVNAIIRIVSSAISGFFVPRAMTNADVTLADAGNVLVRVTGLTANHTLTLPASPTTGQSIVVADEDGSLASKNIIVSGNGKNIQVGTISAATYTMTSVTPGPGGALTFIYNGAFWKAA